MGLLNLTESERLEILNLHNNARIIKEQVAPTVPAAGTPAAAPQTVADVIKELQTLLNTKYGTQLTVDGKWGNLTQTAFETALKSKSPVTPKATGEITPKATGEITPPVAPVTPKTVIPGTPDAPNPTAPVVPGQPAPAPVTPAAPEVPAAPATPAAPLSNRDQRRQRQDLRRGNRRAMQDLRGQQRAQ